MKKSSKESVIEQSKKSRWYRKWSILVFLIVFGGIGSGVYVFAQKQQANTTDRNQTSTGLYNVKTDTIRISVEGEGKIMNPSIVNLSFLINGTLEDVLVKEGQKVQKGDILAELDKREYEFDLQDAQNQVRIVRANIQSKEAEIIDDDLRVAENDLRITKENLANSRNDYEQTLSQSLDSGRIAIESAFPEIQKALENTDSLLGIDNNRAQYALVAATFNNSILKNDVINKYKEIKRAKENLLEEYNAKKPLNDEDVANFLWQMKNRAENTQDMVEITLDLFSNAVPNSLASNADIESAESMVKSTLSSIDSQVNALTSARQKIENAYLSLENGIKEKENSIKTSQLKLENTQDALEQRTIAKQTSLTSLAAQLDQALVKVDKAKYNLELTTLTAPIDGEIIVVNGNPGETVKVESTSSDNALIRILSDANFTTEIYVEEVDIAKIQVGQKAIITMDAIMDTELEGEVSYIASTATTDNNGITTYLVRVDITDPKDAPIKEGMSTYVEFLVENAENVLVVPNTAIQNEKVQLENSEWVSVETGITDGRNTEIKEGLTVGQSIWRIPQDTTSGAIQTATNKGTPEDRMARIESLLREQGVLPENWDSLSTSEKQKAVQTLRESGSLQSGNGERGSGTPPPH